MSSGEGGSVCGGLNNVGDVWHLRGRGGVEHSSESEGHDGRGGMRWAADGAVERPDGRVRVRCVCEGDVRGGGDDGGADEERSDHGGGRRGLGGGGGEGGVGGADEPRLDGRGCEPGAVGGEGAAGSGGAGRRAHPCVGAGMGGTEAE